MIREAQPGDVLRVKMLWAAAEEESDLPLPYRGGDIEQVAPMIAARRILVAEESKGVCGFVAYNLIGDIYSGLNLYVAGEWRGRGLGAELVREAHRAAKEQGAKRAVTILAKKSNRLPFYLHVGGYEDTGHVMTKEF